MLLRVSDDIALIAGLIDQQCSILREQQAEVLRARQRLMSLSAWWPDSSGPIRLSAASAELLTTVPDWDVRLGVGSGAPVQWRDLLAKLIDGDADAAYQEAPVTVDRVEAA